MIKLTYILLMSFLISAYSFPQHHRERKKGNPKYMTEEMRKIRNVKGSMDIFKICGVSLDDYQKSVILSLYEDADNLILDLNNNIEYFNIEIKKELMLEQPNMEKVKSLISEKNNALSELEYTKIKIDLDIISVLNEDQKEKIRQHFKNTKKG